MVKILVYQNEFADIIGVEYRRNDTLIMSHGVASQFLRPMTLECQHRWWDGPSWSIYNKLDEGLIHNEGERIVYYGEENDSVNV